MKILVDGGLPFVPVTIWQGEKTLKLENVLLNTGSAGTIFPTDKLKASGFIRKMLPSFAGLLALAVMSLSWKRPLTV